MKKMFIIQLKRYKLWEDVFKSSNIDDVLLLFIRLKNEKLLVRVVEVTVI